jgi:hypothetical protein
MEVFLERNTHIPNSFNLDVFRVRRCHPGRFAGGWFAVGDGGPAGKHGVGGTSRFRSGGRNCLARLSAGLTEQARQFVT